MNENLHGPIQTLLKIQRQCDKCDTPKQKGIFMELKYDLFERIIINLI